MPDLTPEALAGLKKNRLRLPLVRDILFLEMDNVKFRPEEPESLGLCERCLLSFNAGPPLTPSAYNNLRIIQTSRHVELFTEMIHDARVVPMDGSPHPPKDIQKWTGDSRGRNGVVGSGKNMYLAERFTLVGESRLVYEYTLDDPSTFTKPFTVAIPMRASEDQIFEYACHEGSHAMTGMLKGARTLEKEAAP